MENEERLRSSDGDPKVKPVRQRVIAPPRPSLFSLVGGLLAIFVIGAIIFWLVMFITTSSAVKLDPDQATVLTVRLERLGVSLRVYWPQDEYMTVWLTVRNAGTHRVLTLPITR